MGSKDVVINIDGQDWKASLEGSKVSISKRDGYTWVWCGDGILRDGSITDCSADIGDAVYEALEEGLE